MKSSLSQLLHKEHDIILEAGKIINLNKNLWLTNSLEYKRVAKQLLDFFSIYADQIHHHKEEEILFPAISKKNEIVGGNMVPELMEHHDEFRLIMEQVKAALDINDFPSVQQLLESYISKLKDHIAVEDDELFPMADDIFSQGELDKMYYKCVDIDNELGLVQKEKFENLIKNLKRNEAVQ